MGLCKCQKRKVTNLFCFEHDVNVCEYCLVADHEGVKKKAIIFIKKKTSPIKAGERGYLGLKL